MINFKDVMKGVETVLNDNLDGYIITRNEERNTDPSVASQFKGWRKKPCFSILVL